MIDTVLNDLALVFVSLTSSCATVSGCASVMGISAKFGKVFLASGSSHLFFSPGLLLCSFGFFASLVSLSFPLFLFLVNKYGVFTVSQDLPNLTRIPLLSSYGTLFSVMAFVMVCNSILSWLFVIYMSRFSAPWRQRSYFFCSQSYPITHYSAGNS